MQFDPLRPIWLQVMGEIETSIVTGGRLPGEKLPGGRELAVQYGINPNTAARVYQELEREGLCESRRGMGTYVTGNEERIAQVRGTIARQAAVRFADEMEKLGIGRQEAARMILEEEKE